jgi:SAM-dependent methyltransferase
MNESSAMRFGNLPLVARLALGLIGGGGGAALTHSLFGTTGLVVFLCGVMGVGILLLLYAFALRQIQNRRAARFTESVQSQGAQSPSGLNKAEQIAKLDDLRRKFDEGVEVFRRAGKDFYSMPWYLLIGESGSGKSEAMRRSGVKFPAGVQDCLQGVGGTINMHWWFTNHAVVLDLAGRVVFGEVASGVSSEWETFLRLLKKHRPSCPVNGMLLVLPAKSLIRDTPDEMTRKAQQISEQINRVQRVLDVRFPVFVMVTMCDLVTGFREFFEPLRGVDEQQQMLGWSNAQPIDTAFRTEMTEQYLSTVVARLMQRRQVMLRDPTPQRDLSDSRLDEVDALFKLPDGFAHLSGTLKLYLQTIFVPTEWAAKPPFLRGIYFTSSMQEGAALDVELAKALGLPPEKLPEDGIWKRERALFLRDLFLDKVFQEKGLVSHASNVQRQYRRRKIALLGCGAAAAGALLALTCLGWLTLEKRVGRERDLWHYAAGAFAEKGTQPIVSAKAETEVAEYHGNTPLRLVDGSPLTLSELHGRLFASVQRPLDVPRIFRLTQPFSAGFAIERQDAYRTVFERGVLKPLLACVRNRMLTDTGAWTPDATKALSELIRIEAAASGLEYEAKDRRAEPMVALDSLFRFALAAPDYAEYVEHDRPLFNEALAWCYKPHLGGQLWPPAWVSQNRAHSLASDPVLNRGMARFIDDCVRSAPDLEPQVREVVKLREDVQAARQRYEKACRAFEIDLIDVLEQNRELLGRVRGFESVRPLWDDKRAIFSNTVAEAFGAWKDLKQRRAGLRICAGDNIVSNYLVALAESSDKVGAAFKGLTLPIGSNTTTNTTLVVDILALMATARTGVTVRADQEQIDKLRGFEDADRRFSECVQAFSSRLPSYAFPKIPEWLCPPQESWQDRQTRLRKMNVIIPHRALEQFCAELKALCAACGTSSNSAPVVETLDWLSTRAKKGEDAIKGSVVRVTAKEIIERWAGLDTNAIRTRKDILALEADRFGRDFFIGMSDNQDDYVTQFWQDLARDNLVVLVQAAEPLIKEQWRLVRPLGRFPLSLDIGGGKPLSPAELAQAAKALAVAEREFGFSDSRSDRTIGGGARCNEKWIDELLNRLCNPTTTGMFDWMRAARKVVEAMPDPSKGVAVFHVSLEPGEEQRKLTQERKPGSASASDVFENYYVSLRQDKNPAKRHRMGSDALLADVVFPGSAFTLSLFAFAGDTNPTHAVKCLGPDPWSVLSLLLDPWAKRQTENPRRWAVPLRIKQADGEDTLFWLQIETEKVIPLRDEWPHNPPD